MAMENHVHSFKRTYPIKQGKINTEEGIVYIGDGSWAVILEECKDPPSDVIDLFEKRSLEFHVWILEVDIPGGKV